MRARVSCVASSKSTCACLSCFLDIFEDGAQIEFTNLTKAGLEALLAEDPVVLVDVSEHGDAAARFVPWRESNGR